MTWLHRTLLLALSVLALGTTWAAPRLAHGGAGDGASSRQVWERLSEQERDELRARYERFQKLSPQERERMQMRMETLRLLKAKALASMSEERRRHFEMLERSEQDRLLENAVRGEMRRRGGRIRGKLPREWVERLQSASPTARQRMLEEFMRTMQGSHSDRMLRAMAKRLDLSSEEIEGLRRMPWEQRRLRMLEMRRDEIERRVEREGHPPRGVTPDQWERWRALPTPAFFEVWFQVMPQQGQNPMLRDRPRLSPATARAVLDELDVDWRARREDWVHLSVDERRERMAEQTSERLLIILELSGELAPQHLEHLRGLDHRQLRQAVRRIAQTSLEEGGGR